LILRRAVGADRLDAAGRRLARRRPLDHHVAGIVQVRAAGQLDRHDAVPGERRPRPAVAHGRGALLLEVLRQVERQTVRRFEIQVAARSMLSPWVGHFFSDNAAHFEIENGFAGFAGGAS
jgi:hypothetical protein